MPDTILVVDDELPFADGLKRTLCGEGFAVDTAASGREACSRLERQDYSAILLDLKHREAADLIAQKAPDCAIIILTGQATLEAAIEAVRCGCHDYLIKPCHPEQIVHTVRRATENRSLKKELRASQAKYQRLAEATSEGIVLFSSERILETNQQFRDLFGVSEKEVAGLPLRTFIPGLALPDSARLELGNDPAQVMEVEGVRKDGTSVPAEIRVRQVQGKAPPLFLATLRDLTRRRLEELSRSKLEEKLAYAMRMETIGLMAGSVAHDLNNILSSIVSFPELLLLDMPANARYRADIDRIKRAGQQAADVVADLLTVTRGSACRKEIRNLNEIVRGYQDSLDYLNQSRSFPGKTMNFELDPQLGNTRIAPVQVSKALINLVRNGAEAIEGQGTITIATSRRTVAELFMGYEAIPPGQYEVLSVADTGKGIAPQHLEHIFEPFYSRKQLGNSGTGLGLTIIMHTMRDHSGYIDLRSSSAGTVFELYFPTCNSKKIFAESSLALEKLLGKGEKVLVVDDQESQRLLTSAILQRLGYRAYAVENGEQAIRHLQEEPVDLLLLDMILEPGMNGYETFLKIRRLLPHQRAVVTSGYHNHPDRERLKALGISHYLPKPLSVTHLAQAIRQEISS